MSTQRICESCTSSAPSETIKCESVDCAWLFERKKAERKAETIVVLQELANSIRTVYEDKHEVHPFESTAIQAVIL